MIIVKLIGGLGNQMFQYAIGRRLALVRNTQLKLDTSEFSSRYKLRDYALDIFKIRAEIATSSDFLTLRCTSGPIYRKIYKFFKLFGITINKNYILEPSPYFYTDTLTLPDNVYLAFGYWQNKKYFEESLETIKSEFIPRELSSYTKNILHNINNSQSVSLHIRRGDFVTLGAALSEEYYLTAVQKMKEKIDNPTFFVFSDDLKWAREHLRLGGSSVFIDCGERIGEEIFLMNNCKNFIISNSTFSWWGLFLAKDVSGVVVAPKKLTIPEFGRRNLIQI